jgi:hypothetical protein
MGRLQRSECETRLLGDQLWRLTSSHLHQDIRNLGVDEAARELR